MNIALLNSYSLDIAAPSSTEFGDKEETTLGCGSSLRDSFRKLGHNVSTFSLYEGDGNSGMHRCIQAINDGYDPDCVFLLHAGSLRDNLDGLWVRPNFKDVPMISEGGDEWQCFKYNFPHNSKSDLVLTCDNQCVDWYEQHGVAAAWFPVWADERVFYTDNTEKTLGISTTAVPTLTRNQRGFLVVNDALADKFGTDFQNPMRHRQGMDYIPMMENGNLFRKSKIVFQFSSSGEMTRRIVEGAACGAMILTDAVHPIRNLHSLFTEDEDIVFYSTADGCLAKAKYYLENDDERIRISENMNKKIAENHTGLARAKDFINHINSFFGTNYGNEC